jgi:hypothetical protein
MKYTLTAAFAVLLSLSVFAQLDDHRIYNQLIVMMKSGKEVSSITTDKLMVKQCLSKRMNIWLLQSTTEVTEDELTRLRINDNIKLAQYNHRTDERALVPNDPFFGNQWGMNNTGQSSGVVGADIQATDAWAISNDNVTALGDTIVVAIIDGSFDITHEDINFFVNYNEVPGNSIDDDGNGYIDDVNGWNAYDNNGDVASTSLAAKHATHCSGIVGATGNDSVGVAGVCWGAKILPISGSTQIEATAVSAYSYAIDMRILYDATSGAKGAYIVSTNSSFGVNYGNPVDFPIWCAMYDSMGTYGILSAGATANLNINIDTQHDIPTECPSKWLLSVTNTTRNDVRNGGAAYGKINVDLGAPGTGVYSTTPQNNYENMTGTSMATPHVAGAVAAMYSAACPQLMNDYAQFPDSISKVIRQMMFDGAEQTSAMYNLTSSNGRLNLYRAFKQLEAYNCSNCSFDVSATVTNTTCSDTCDGNATITATPPSVNYTYDWSNGISGLTALSGLCQGFYSVTVTDTLAGCQRVVNFAVNKPDTLIITNVNTSPALDGNPGNITIVANSGNHTLTYSLDGSSFQSGAIFTIPTNGNYTVYVKNDYGCVVQKNVFVNDINDAASVISEMKLFPNPAQNQLGVSISIPAGGKVVWEITDALGRQIFGISDEVASGFSQRDFDISALQSGVYHLTAKAEGTWVTRRFVVAK